MGKGNKKIKGKKRDGKKTNDKDTFRGGTIQANVV